ncbi:retropepsin-like aspartic protease family protein [Gloeocapsopsis dulcis]|uniref:Aspartyl protease n=1 Tax=Gloeocapsopsis dulcis AAB1 = 1H9 TaxID=1433147 RepID=A0A6N8FZI6_9CHRO|nr:retropepsin-like aspartic protease [Gloeocapsopsis dulcis]MUL38371.1 aspartyl protease [Gloeocapsopsis dulcis AAB1 = 1H9]WNN91585.1 retropepsin-like aspartic protease [Gloeocapsopsis dulcis]
MLKFYPTPATLIISSTLAIASIACSSKPNINSLNRTHPSTTPVPSAALIKPSTVQKVPLVTPEVQSNQFDLALDKAAAAYSISQSAQSADDWSLVVSKWQEALTLMQTVPADSRYRAIAQKKIAEYQQNISHAQQQIKISSNAVPQLESLPVNLPEPQVIENTPSVQQTQIVIRVPVQRRESGTPVINVTFNGTKRFEMIVDTGASSTVITQETATQLGIIPVTTAKANTASDRGVEFPIGYIDSIEVGGIIANNLPVAIAPSLQLETGLLGHDFFNNYDITFKRDVIEFRLR